ncbi:hypothetical protein KL86PLE_30349 [uncultured Pleomorphomonas sp.]|uniref:Uncharacterized protein n=1 Tax=uncultured Pleomorphomonas sp. TaxID=442121 RepID=A0A212LEA5_9HYPH|nr:hypothetical protein KL86PLE_30349 [uncultured Pleomorphomonas sp.]
MMNASPLRDDPGGAPAGVPRPGRRPSLARSMRGESQSFEIVAPQGNPVDEGKINHPGTNDPAS